MNASVADEGKIKTIKAYEKKYSDIENTIDPLKKTVLLFSVSWCGPCKNLKKKLEETSNIDYSSVEIIYVVTDLDSKDKRAEDGMPNPSMAKSLEKLGQGYWPFIMLFEPGFKTAISSFPVSETYKDPCPNMLFYDRIMDFIKDGSICQ
jgi:thiol-disulfide isomerase/thioredoxin